MTPEEQQQEPTLQVSPDQVFAILGQKEVERLMLINRVQQLEARIKELSDGK